MWGIWGTAVRVSVSLPTIQSLTRVRDVLELREQPCPFVVADRRGIDVRPTGHLPDGQRSQEILPLDFKYALSITLADRRVRALSIERGGIEDGNRSKRFSDTDRLQTDQ
jgi:hypothetical protein